MLKDKLTHTIADSVRQVSEAKYEPAEPNAAAIAARKKREENEARRAEKEDGETSKAQTRKVQGTQYGGGKQKEVDESVEQIDEISKDTARSYLAKSGKQIDKGIADKAKREKRIDGYFSASKRLSNEAPTSDKAKTTNESAEQTDDEHYQKQSKKMQDAINLHLRKGKTYKDAVAAASTHVKESASIFTNLLESYKVGGIKSLFESLSVKEEASEEEFNTELNKQKDKAEGKGEKADVAKAAVQAVQKEEWEPEKEVKKPDGKVDAELKSAAKKNASDLQKVSDAFAKKKVDESTEEQIDERHLTADEKKEVEKNVKGMKKKLSGFKERYGERAKEVMYATATKQAKED